MTVTGRSIHTIIVAPAPSITPGATIRPLRSGHSHTAPKSASASRPRPRSGGGAGTSCPSSVSYLQLGPSPVGLGLALRWCPVRFRFSGGAFLRSPFGEILVWGRFWQPDVNVEVAKLLISLVSWDAPDNDFDGAGCLAQAFRLTNRGLLGCLGLQKRPGRLSSARKGNPDATLPSVHVNLVVGTLRRLEFQPNTCGCCAAISPALNPQPQIRPPGPSR